MLFLGRVGVKIACSCSCEAKAHLGVLSSDGSWSLLSLGCLWKVMMDLLKMGCERSRVEMESNLWPTAY